MYLHENKEIFKASISQVNQTLEIESALIEKDYYITMLLQKLREKEPDIIFKGGTCLSKCYKIINRFSEDIDISLFNVNSQPQSKKKKLSLYIKEILVDLGMTLNNAEQIKSGMSYNDYKAEYKTLFDTNSIDATIRIETMFLVNAFPTITMPVTSLIYDYLNETGNQSVIEKYNLQPFEMTVQSLERTFVDKVFALGTHHLSNKKYRQSRHLYDLHQILPYVQVDKKLMQLFDDVRQAWDDRKSSKDWQAAEDRDDLLDVLQYIIDNEVYRDDYENITSLLLYDDVSYEEAITSFSKIVSSMSKAMDGGSEM